MSACSRPTFDLLKLWTTWRTWSLGSRRIGRRGVEKSIPGDGRQGDGVGPDVAAGDDKRRAPEQGQRHHEIGKPTTQLARPAVAPALPAFPAPEHLPVPAVVDCRRPRTRLPLLDASHAGQLGVREPTMWPADWIPVSEKSSVEAVSGVQRRAAPQIRRALPFLTLPDGMLTRGSTDKDCEKGRPRFRRAGRASPANARLARYGLAHGYFPRLAYDRRRCFCNCDRRDFPPGGLSGRRLPRPPVRQRQRPDPRQPNHDSGRARAPPRLTRDDARNFQERNWPSRAGCPSSERTHMHRLLPSVFTAAFALAFFGMVQANQTALAQGPDKPAAQPAPPAARAAPRAAPAARPAQPAARAAPRAACRSQTSSSATGATSCRARSRNVQRAQPQRPAAVQRARPQQPAAVQRTRPQQPAAVQRAPQQQRQALPPQSAPKQVERGPRRPDVATTPSARPVSRVQATDQQRREVRQRLFADRGAQRISRNQLNVPLATGSRIPRRHQLLRFAPALLALIPAYAAYRYLIVDDTICVVDPETYGIVDVIPSSIEQAGLQSTERPALALSTDQMRCIYSATPMDQARSDLRIRLALGAEIPRNVELFAFPEEGLSCAPELAGYRYIVVQDDVVIVDPADYAIAAVISG